MKKRFGISAMTVFFAMLLGIAVMFAGTEQASAMKGDGTADNPYQISTYNDLMEFAKVVNGTHDRIQQNTAACAILTADIDATGKRDWIPIGNDLDPNHFDFWNLYMGTFDGKGHTITGLKVDNYSEPAVGLFGGSSGVIKNVGIVNNNFNFINNHNIHMRVLGTGGVVGYNEGTVENCYNTGNVSGSGEGVGGVVGFNSGTISNCYNTGAVSGRAQVGGVVGYNYETISNCYNTGNVSGKNEVGGVVGYMGEKDTASNCYNTGKVSGDNYVGGVIGWNNYGTVKNCYYDSDLLTGVFPIGENYDRGTVINVTGLPTDEMTGVGALDYMIFDDNDGERPWETKEDDPNYWYYPHLKGFQYDTTGDPGDWPAKTDVGTVATPTFSPVAGDFGAQESITISCTTKDATIYYTTDGSDPTDSSNEYTEPITITDTTTIKAMAVKERFTNSQIASATYYQTIHKLKPSGTPTAKVKAGKKSLSIEWGRIDGAEGYDIFFARCNHSGKKIVSKNVKTIKGNNIFKWTKSGLKKGTTYKSYVRAYVMKDGKKTYISKSPIMHAYTGNVKGKYTNAKAVKVNKTSVTLKKGATFKIKAKVSKVKKNKKLMPKSHVKTVRYLTTDKNVATVSASGKITARGSGTCTIVAFAHNGVSRNIKVTVK